MLRAFWLACALRIELSVELCSCSCRLRVRLSTFANWRDIGYVASGCWPWRFGHSGPALRFRRLRCGVTAASGRLRFAAAGSCKRPSLLSGVILDKIVAVEEGYQRVELSLGARKTSTRAKQLPPCNLPWRSRHSTQARIRISCPVESTALIADVPMWRACNGPARRAFPLLLLLVKFTSRCTKAPVTGIVPTTWIPCRRAANFCRKSAAWTGPVSGMQPFPF